MDVFDATRTVLAIRSYSDKPVPTEVANRILEAGRLTASASNSQPWHFIVVQDKDTIHKLGSIIPTGPYIAGAPLLIVVAIDHTDLAISDGSRAVQSMILTAWAEGIGSNWVGFLGPDAVKPVLGIPATLDVLAILPFGYPAQPVGKGKKKRKPLSEIASLNKFDQPYK